MSKPPRTPLKAYRPQPPSRVVQRVVAHTIDSQQARTLAARILQLQAAVQQDRTTHTNLLAAGNVVYRNQHGNTLAALHAAITQREGHAAGLVNRGNALRGGVTTEATYNTLVRDVRQREREQAQGRRTLTTHARVATNPTRNIGVANLANAAANVVTAQLTRWAAGQDNAIAHTIIERAPDNQHPHDPRWRVVNQNLNNVGNGANNNHEYGSGSIPTTAHGARNLNAARNNFRAALTAAGYT